MGEIPTQQLILCPNLLQEHDMSTGLLRGHSYKRWNWPSSEMTGGVGREGGLNLM